MPYVTQTRTQPVSNIQNVHYYLGKYPELPTYTVIPGDSQTTMSWRTSRSDPIDQDEVLRAAQKGGIGAMNHQLSREYHDRFDNGHEFQTDKTYRIRPHNHEFASRRNLPIADPFYTYKGAFELFNAYGYGDFVSSIPYLTTSQMNVLGARAIRKTTPTKPEAGLAQALGELRERLPQLVGAAAARDLIRYQRKNRVHSSAAATASEHLNWQFGVLPTVNDIQKLARGVLHTSKIVKQYSRDSGKNIRRKAQLGSESRILGEYSVNGQFLMGTINGYSQEGNYYQGNSGRITIVDSMNQSSWFSGAYTYHLSTAHTALGRLARYEELANQLLGLRMNVDTVWELTPWSWLFDWMSDMGAFLANVSAFSDDSLVLRYGYVMTTTEATRTQTMQLPPLQPGGKGPAILTQYGVTLQKRRVKSTPYGFGLDVKAFSPKQWSILAALGISKTAGVLK